MAQRNRVAANQDFLHQQPQNLLSHCDVQRFGPNPQLAAKSRHVLCQL
jgi:hypothetical protein